MAVTMGQAIDVAGGAERSEHARRACPAREVSRWQ
jgi:hypothetical protein